MFNRKICKIDKRFKYSWIKVCRFWVKANGKILPRITDTILFRDEYIKIGSFINSLRYGYNSRLKPKIEEIFGLSL